MPHTPVLTGLSAFPLTPVSGDRIDETAFTRIVERLAHSGVSSIGALGSTGSGAYLDRDERARAARLAVSAAGDTPVIVGISALRTSQVLAAAADAQDAGAAAVLLAPMTYQTLGRDEVYALYADVAAELSVPLVVYDNPATTHFTFDDDLYAALARLPAVGSIKIPGVPRDPAAAQARLSHLHQRVGPDVTLGVSGDAHGAAGLIAGCDAWYSVLAGVLPRTVAAIADLARQGRPQRAQADAARAASARLDPLWEQFAAHGSLRVAAAIAEHLRLAEEPCLPAPVRGVSPEQKTQIARIVDDLGLAA